MWYRKYFTKFAPACIFNLMLLLGSLISGAQIPLTFKGRILDSETKEPLQFVTVEIRKSGTGVISNEFGEFQYHLPPHFEKDTVQISYIGYERIKISVSDIKQEISTTFILEPKIQELPEIEITGIMGSPAIEVVNKAIRNIRKNYPKDKALLYGYYRDYVSSRRDDNYRNLTEAALIIEDLGFNRSDFNRTKVKLEQLRYHPGIVIDSSLNRGYDGKNKFIPYASIEGKNELSILRMHDPIRNHAIRTFSFVYIFDWQFAMNHQFSYESVTEVDSYKMFCINFESHKKNLLSPGEYWVKGQIYIHSQTYVIQKFTYSVSCNLPSYNGRLFDLKLEYKNFEGKHYLNYLSLMNYFELKQNAADSIESANAGPFFQFRELFINKIVQEPFESLHAGETINKDSSLNVNRVPVKEGFWERYNYPSTVANK